MLLMDVNSKSGYILKILNVSRTFINGELSVLSLSICLQLNLYVVIMLLDQVYFNYVN